MCLAQVTLLPTALTKLTGTNCLGVSAGSAGRRHTPICPSVPDTFQGGALPGMNEDHITSGRPHFVNIGMVFQCVIGSASQPTSPHDCCLWPADRHSFHDRSKKDFLISRLRSLPPRHHTPTSNFTKSRSPVYSISFFVQKTIF